MKVRLRRLLWRSVQATALLALLGVVAVAVCWFAFPFPMQRLDPPPACPIVRDRTGGTMLQLVSLDDQWRMPVPAERISPWLRSATIAVEDERFYSHPGVDALAVGRAAWQNVSAGRVVSGASTITMQLCRMLDPQPRTLWPKLVESFRALQLERQLDKDQILTHYLNLAPYGGNIRGAAAASLLYFNKSPEHLSLGEAALLAGLPQSPERYRPDRQPDAARSRRRVVLGRMLACGMISAQQRDDADREPIVLADRRQQQYASHAAWLALQLRPAGAQTTIDPAIQRHLARLAREHLLSMPAGANVSIVAIEIASGDIVGLVGSADANDPAGGHVCGATAWRSPGSALKPFIYAAAFEAGRAAPDSTLYDVPINRAGWTPDNFDREFSGEVSAGDALRRSLNVPAILVAEGVGLARCVGLAEAAGVDFYPPARSRGGLATVVGGVEVRLLDLTNAYATIGRGGVRQRSRIFLDEPADPSPAIDANVCATLDEVLSSRARRPAGLGDMPESQTPWFMWKTGTSSGRRDAWAVGHNGRFAIGVWVGRFSGGGDTRFVGGEAAEPLLARLFTLPSLRVAEPPRSPTPILVSRPLPRPPEVDLPLRILSPADGAAFHTIGGRAIVHVRVNRAGRLDWFLDGRLLDAPARRLELEPGPHELRAVGPDGQSHRLRLVVQ